VSLRFWLWVGQKETMSRIESRMTPGREVTGSQQRLDSWKEISAYLGKSVRTVQRWERTEGLPVRRLGQDATSPVFAYKEELDAWWQQQSRRLSPEPDVAESDTAMPSGTKSLWQIFAIASLAGVIALGAAVWSLWPQRAAYRPVPFTTDHGWEVHPAFSPDARRIAYVGGQNRGTGFIYTKAIGGDSSARVTKGTESERSPVWSPDGKMIAFFRRAAEGQATSLIMVPAAGGPETRIGEVVQGGTLVWSSDGRWLVATEGGVKERAIVAISVLSGAKHRVTEPYEFGYCGFGLAADLGRLIYCSGGPGPSTIFEVKLGPGLRPAGQPRALLSNVWLSEMIITADAKEIIYTNGIYSESDGLWRRRLSPGSTPEPIVETSDQFLTPAISPDGSRLVFGKAFVERVETWRLPLGDAAAARASPLLTSTHSDMNPSYSPDGRFIAFHSTRSGASEIWVVNRDGTNPRRLTSTNARTTATPRWSPDGGWIVYESTEPGQSEVYTIRSNGGPAQRLTFDAATDAIPNWSRDGRTIYFCSNRTRRFEIWKMPALGGAATQVTRGGGFAAVESLDSKFLYYSQTRNHGPIWRMPVGGGEPEMVAPEFNGLFFAVTGDGVYFQVKRSIMKWEAATGKTREIHSSQERLGIGLAASPDGKELLFTQYFEPEEMDLYLIDGLR